MGRRTLRALVRHQTLLALSPDTTVREAARRMAERGVGAAPVMAGDALVGIFTERDVLVRVVAADGDPDRTRVAAVMTPEPRTIAADATPLEALRQMHEGDFRHVLVVDGRRLIGIVSMRDFGGADMAELEAELDRCAAIAEGPGYGKWS